MTLCFNAVCSGCCGDCRTHNTVLRSEDLSVDSDGSSSPAALSDVTLPLCPHRSWNERNTPTVCSSSSSVK